MSEEQPPSRVLRQQFQDEYALPLARAVFELEPRCQSVLITVGQYWCDEANDAVHCETIACTERDPTWPLAGQVHPGAIGHEEALRAQFEVDDDGEPYDLSQVQEGLFVDANKKAFNQDLCFLDENTDMIVAFASYCREVGDQEEPRWRSHTPYGLIRRPLDGEPPTFEVIGQMYRPEWEDRWDAVERGYLVPFGDSPPQGQHESTNQPSKPKFVQRLLLIIIVWTAVLVLRRLLK